VAGCGGLRLRAEMVWVREEKAEASYIFFCLLWLHTADALLVWGCGGPWLVWAIVWTLRKWVDDQFLSKGCVIDGEGSVCGRDFLRFCSVVLGISTAESSVGWWA
jgi:hypothetical protein